MAIEIRGHPAFRLPGVPVVRRRRAGPIGWFLYVCRSVGRCVRMALLPALAIGMVVSPPVLFSLAQSLVARKGVEQQQLYAEIGNNRARLTQLQDELRRALRPGVLAGWAKSRSMVTPGPPVFIGATGLEVSSRP